MPPPAVTDRNAIKPIEAQSVSKITSSQVVVDLQTAVKELVENSLDAKATNIEVRLKDNGLALIEVADNGTGIAPEDYPFVAAKHATSKLESYEDLTSIYSFGFRGEALFSLCALSEKVSVTTSTGAQGSMGTILEFDREGRLVSSDKKVARQRGTTVSVHNLFKPLPVRRRELERNAKREVGKLLNLMNAYALVPCTKQNQGVRLTVSNQTQGGKKSDQLKTQRTSSLRSAVSALWGPKSLDTLVDLDLEFEVETEKTILRRRGISSASNNSVKVNGLVSKFSVGGGRASTDRQFYFVNGRPCNPTKVAKAVNEVYRTFNMNQSPFIIADFIIPTDSCDINVSPDKRTILLHSENNLVEALKAALQQAFSDARSTFTLSNTQVDSSASAKASQPAPRLPLFLRDLDDEDYGLVGNSPASSAEHASSQSKKVDLTNRIQNPATDTALDVRESELADSRVSDPITPSTTADRVDNLRSPSPPATYVGRRGPAQIERIISTTNNTARLLKSRDTELVLDTTKASWSVPRSPAGPPSKRARRDSVTRDEVPSRPQPRKSGNATVGKRAQADIRDMLRGFALTGSQVQVQDSEEELDELYEERARNTSTPDEEMEVDTNDAANVDVDAEDDLTLPDQLAADHGVSPSASTPTERELAPEENDDPQMDVDTASSELPTFKERTKYSSPPTGSNVADGLASNERATKGKHASSKTTSTVASSTLDDGSDPAPEFVRTVGRDDTTLTFDIDRISTKWRTLKLGHTTQSVPSSTASQEVNGVDEAGLSSTDDDEATSALARVLRKEDFLAMKIVGQFNKGFIIARRQTDKLDDLFIIDQHAADEKYNFETLQQTTKIESQKLFRPKELELPMADELVAIDNLDVLEQNGFEVDADSSSDSGSRRLKLVAAPVSKNTEFNEHDLEELIHLMRDLPTGTMVRCSKARAMFASRACRKSIMVGAALTHKQMGTVVRNMSTMVQPWHCPHGRPTMRHLVDLSGFRGRNRGVDWQVFKKDD